MSNHKFNQNLIIGAAVAAGILGTLTGLLGNKRANRGWTDKAKDVANQMLESRDMVNKKMVLGGVAGGLVGAAAALLLTPKSGSDLIRDIARPFVHRGDHHAHPGSRKKGKHKKGARLTKSRSAEHKHTEKHTEKKGRKKSHSKKLSSRRRTTSAISKITPTHEKVESGAKEA